MNDFESMQMQTLSQINDVVHVIAFVMICTFLSGLLSIWLGRK